MSRSPDRLREALWVMQAQAGDAAAFEQLVRDWHPRLWRFAHAATGDPDAASDVVQEAFTAIVRGFSDLDDPASFRPWAYRITRNKSADWIRRRQRERKLANEQRWAGAPAAASRRARTEIGERIRDAIRPLAPDLRALLMLRYAEELTIAEMANVLEVAEGTVKSRLHKARGELRRSLEEDEHD